LFKNGGVHTFFLDAALTCFLRFPRDSFTFLIERLVFLLSGLSRIFVLYRTFLDICLFTREKTLTALLGGYVPPCLVFGSGSLNWFFLAKGTDFFGD